MKETASFPSASEWERSAVCQVYPRSFNEVRNNPADLRGEGSMLGITEKLPDLREMGIDAIWISPFFPSPMTDGGYDVSSYVDVDSRYGTLEDFYALTERAHELDMKVMIDFVPNHTSDQHRWFKNSKSSADAETNPYADWYIWRDPNPDGTPPNNHVSVFSKPNLRAVQAGDESLIQEDGTVKGIPAWTLSPERGQYYYHSFNEHQPDLNWEQPAVREAMCDTLRFWIEQGVDGFRIDAFNHVGKNPELPNELPFPDYKPATDNPYDALIHDSAANFLPTLSSYAQQLTSVFDSYPERDLFMIFEAYAPTDVTRMLDSTHPQAKSFYFRRMNAPFDAKTHQRLMDEQYAAPGIATNVIANHDRPLPVNNYGSKGARMMATLNLMLPGMSFVYQKEIGGDHAFYIPEELRDDIQGERDDARTPMLWNANKNAGFSDADTTWLPVQPNFDIANLEAQKNDPRSFFSLYRTLLALRKQTAWQEGSYAHIESSDEESLSFGVQGQSGDYTVIANFSDEETVTRITGVRSNIGRIVLSSLHYERTETVHFNDELRLDPKEALVILSDAPTYLPESLPSS